MKLTSAEPADSPAAKTRTSVPSRPSVTRSSYIRVLTPEAIRREKDRRRKYRVDRVGLQRVVARLAGDPRYRGKYVAIYRNHPIDVDDDEEALLQRILRRREDPVHLVFVENPRD